MNWSVYNYVLGVSDHTTMEDIHTILQERHLLPTVGTLRLYHFMTLGLRSRHILWHERIMSLGVSPLQHIQL
jgi:hypothetical protein